MQLSICSTQGCEPSSTSSQHALAIGRRSAADDGLSCAALGDDAPVRKWWSAPAAGLGLRLLAGLSFAGLFQEACWSGAQLRQVVGEALSLEAWWVQADLPYDVLADLREASACLREAAGIAEECDGWLVIA